VEIQEMKKKKAFKKKGKSIIKPVPLGTCMKNYDPSDDVKRLDF